MSDSELSEAVDLPTDAKITECLQQVVRDGLKADEDITINLARSRAEKALALDAEFFKNNTTWKSKSKEIIQATVEDRQSPVKPKKSVPKAKAKPAPKAGTKRKSDEAQPKTKRQKKAVAPPESDEDDDEVAADSEIEDGAKSPAPASNAKVSKKTSVGDSEDEEPKADDSALSEPPKEADEAPKTNGKPAMDDDSDMSDVIDEPLPKKKRQKKSTSPSANKDKTKKAAKPAKAGKELTVDDEEIKRLQGWLVKCGIRKVWGKELAKCDTSKAKIKHLRSLLEDAGMTGRYSAEKAKQIKESRELAAEIEAANEFNDQWGQKKGEIQEESEESAVEEEIKARPRKPRGLIDFGDSGDEDSP
ncbi:hypothetical protein LTR78_007920 [Recurvomyces mirabilis]|uniref:Transcriptional regulator n=1 Tax=Recurvomyces mirabilis TaxID=574656 RepID=A0AAE0WH64_9PEZI|nr:hypothetical protein LTR78_007920 [Recurvomyces mirabilis]KAK5152455.1 hypothetical protein LTS14_008402 [Recurvomyces mirabilis]